MTVVSLLPAYAPAFGDQTLFLLPSGTSSVTLKDGYIPLLANFTYEDKAAKELRKRTADDKPEPPVHFSALEVVRDTRYLFLNGKPWSGKTTLAKYLYYSVATGGLEKPRPIIRNETGIVKEESWAHCKIEPHYYIIHCLETMKRLIDEFIPEALAKQKKKEKHEALIVLVGI